VLTALALVACVPKHEEPLPSRKTSALAKGDRAYAKGKLEAAQAEYALAVDAGGPEANDARYQRARVRVERGDLAGAEADATAVVTAAPRHWEALCLLGLVREKQGRRAEAVEHFAKAAEIAPRELAPRNNLAFLSLQDGRDREAYDLLVTIVRDFPDSTRAWSNLATAAERLGLTDEAATAREAARRLADADEQEPE
jgi:Flp pilus assembly protein TadD